MEYGIWSLHAASGLWGDPRLVRRAAALVPPGVPPLLPRAGFAFSSLHHPLDPSAYQAVELTTKSSNSVNSDEARSETSTPLDTIKKSDNESNIERNEDDEEHDYKVIPNSVPNWNTFPNYSNYSLNYSLHYCLKYCLNYSLHYSLNYSLNYCLNYCLKYYLNYSVNHYLNDYLN